MKTRTAFVLLACATSVCPPAADAVSKTRSVAVRVRTTGSEPAFTHQVYVTNKDEMRTVDAIVVGLYPGIPSEPSSIAGPKGWVYRVVPREREGRPAWAVEFRCGSRRAFATDAAAKETRAEPEGIGCGIANGKTASFDLTLRFRSWSIETGPVFVVFSDGEEAVAVP